MGAFRCVVWLVWLLLSVFQALAQQPPDASDTPFLDVPALTSLETPDWLELSGAARFRFEDRRSLGFRGGADDAYGFFRVRLNIGIRPREDVFLFVQAQDARAPGIRPAAANGVSRDPFDLRQAYLQIGRPEDSLFTLRAGRQTFRYGDQRLVGPLEWANTARSFDAVKLEVRTRTIAADVFAAAVVHNDPVRQINRSEADDNFHGLYVRLNDLPAEVAIEPFLFWRTLGEVQGASGFGDMDQYTAGVYSARRPTSGWEYVASFARQWGQFADAEIDAAFFPVLGGYRFDIGVEPHLFVEYNYASGDGDAADRTVGSFDNIYPTAHIYYGYNDLVGLRNIKNLRVGSSLRAAGRVTLGFDFHSFWLADPHDNLYNAGGAVAVASPPGGASNTSVGDELDVFVTLPVSNVMTLSGGVGRMFPGPFLKKHSPGAAHTLTYVAVDYRF